MIGASQKPPIYIGWEIEKRLDWKRAVGALKAGLLKGRGEIGDLLMASDKSQLLARAAVTKGVGAGLKVVTITPENAQKPGGKPAVQGAFLLFDKDDGALQCIIDGALLTKWKTAADSALAASLLVGAPPARLAIMGAGAMAGALTEAYPAIFPSLETITVWARNKGKAEAFAARCALNGRAVVAKADAQKASAEADIIASATGAHDPIVRGAWVKPGAHVDLIGAYRKEMREGDDALHARANIYVDDRRTAIDDIGELSIPMKNGAITRDDILADLFELCRGDRPEGPGKDITVFKNGGGAHLDLMMAQYFLSVRTKNA